MNKRMFILRKYFKEIDMSNELNRGSVYGSALGPDWSVGLPIKGASKVFYNV